jgi:hypothetical protein
MKTAIVAPGLVLLSCTQMPRADVAEQYYSPTAIEAEMCERSSRPGYGDPETLARDYVERDGRGEFARTNRWLLDTHYCARGLPGWDIVTIVKEALFDSLVVEGPQAHAYVTYRRLGTADRVSFTATLDDEQVRMPLVRLEMAGASMSSRIRTSLSLRRWSGRTLHGRIPFAPWSGTWLETDGRCRPGVLRAICIVQRVKQVIEAEGLTNFEITPLDQAQLARLSELPRP